MARALAPKLGDYYSTSHFLQEQISPVSELTVQQPISPQTSVSQFVALDWASAGCAIRCAPPIAITAVESRLSKCRFYGNLQNG